MSDMMEKIGALDAKVTAAHNRVDKLEIMLREDLKEILTDLKEIHAYMNKGKGWAAALMLLAGTSGAGIMKLLALMGK